MSYLFSELLNKYMEMPLRAHLLSSERNHNFSAKAHTLAYLFHELRDEVSLLGITVMLPELLLLCQQYFDIVDCVCSLWGRYNLNRTCALSNNLLIFRCWAYLMKVIPESRRANWIWYLRFINTIPTWFHVFLQDLGAYIYQHIRIVSLHIIFPEKLLKITIYRPWLL